MEPAPKKIRAKVPMNSATNIWKVVYMAGILDEEGGGVGKDLSQRARRAEHRGRGEESNERLHSSRDGAQQCLPAVGGLRPYGGRASAWRRLRGRLLGLASCGGRVWCRWLGRKILPGVCG